MCVVFPISAVVGGTVVVFVNVSDFYTIAKNQVDLLIIFVCAFFESYFGCCHVSILYRRIYRTCSNPQNTLEFFSVSIHQPALAAAVSAWKAQPGSKKSSKCCPSNSHQVFIIFAPLAQGPKFTSSRSFHTVTRFPLDVAKVLFLRV